MDYYPDRAYQLVTNLTSAIIEANRSSQVEDFRTTEEFSTTQLLEYKRRLVESETSLEQFRRAQANRAVTPTLVNALSIALVEELKRQAQDDVGTHSAESSTSESRLRGFGLGADALAGILADPAIETERATGRELEESYVRQSLIEAGNPGMSSQATAIQLARIVTRIQGLVRSALQTGRSLSGDELVAAEGYLTSRVRAPAE